MKKIIIIIIIVATILIIGVYIFIKDREIKKELSTVEKSEFVDSSDSKNLLDIVSKIKIARTNGTWNITSNDGYVINPDSLMFEFRGYKPGAEHPGTFNNITAEIDLDSKGNPSSAKFVFDPKSVKTDAEGLDKHLQDSVFFNTEKYPQIVVVVKEIKKDKKGETKAITDLTMKGVTKTLSIPVTITPTDSGFKFAIDTRITISDYSIAYGPVLDEVRIMLGAELNKI